MTLATRVLEGAYLARALDDEIRALIVNRRWYRDPGPMGGLRYRWSDMEARDTAALRALLRVRSAAKRRAGR